jgi:hypothetical protein
VAAFFVECYLNNRELKSQVPSSKLQKTSMLEIPKATGGRPLPGLLELGIWTFFGAWSLGFGASTVRRFNASTL